MKIDKEQNEETFKIEKKMLGSCEYYMRRILVVLLFQTAPVPVVVRSCYDYVPTLYQKHFNLPNFRGGHLHHLQFGDLSADLQRDSRSPPVTQKVGKEIVRFLHHSAWAYRLSCTGPQKAGLLTSPHHRQCDKPVLCIGLFPPQPKSYKLMFSFPRPRDGCRKSLMNLPKVTCCIGTEAIFKVSFL